MKRTIGRRLDMALRVREFCHKHPFTEPRSAAVVARFEERLVRAEALAVRQRSDHAAAIAFNARRNEIRRTNIGPLLKHVSRVAQVASEAEPELAGKIRIPPQDVSNQAFLAATRGIVQVSSEYREALLDHGLPEVMLTDLSDALAQFEEAASAANAATQGRTGAAAELDRISKVLVTTVGLLDGLNRYRFRDHREALSSWIMVARVGPSRARKVGNDGTGDSTELRLPSAA